MRLLIACIFCTLSVSANAQIYEYTDAQGNTVFTDQPPEGQVTVTVDLPPINTVPLATEGEAAAATDSTANVSSPPYTTLVLSGVPNDDAAIRANNGSFNVNVTIDPPLAPGNVLRLVLDGKPYGKPSTQLTLPLTNVYRGEHTLAVEVLSGEQVIQRSLTHTFTVQRVDIHSPAFRRPHPPR